MPRGRFYGLLAGAVLLYAALFLGRGLGPLDFWWGLAFNAGILLILCFAFDRDYGPRLLRDLRTRPLRKTAAGLLSAAALYGVFWLGNRASRAWLPFAAGGIADTYALKTGVNPARIALLMVLLIGPAEELLWRGFLQRHAQARWGAGRGFAAVTALYAAVHLGSGNPMLVLAALVCGTFWGAMYARGQSVVLNVVSHTVWDVLVFLVFPFHG